MIYNPDFIFKCGDRFVKKSNSTGFREEFLLCEGGWDNRSRKIRVLLVNLKTGNRWNEGVLIQFPDWITMDEFVRVVSTLGNIRDLEKFDQIGYNYHT